MHACTQTRPVVAIFTDLIFLMNNMHGSEIGMAFFTLQYYIDYHHTVPLKIAWEIWSILVGKC